MIYADLAGTNAHIRVDGQSEVMIGDEVEVGILPVQVLPFEAPIKPQCATWMEAGRDLIDRSERYSGRHRLFYNPVL